MIDSSIDEEISDHYEEEFAKKEIVAPVVKEEIKIEKK